MSIALPEIGIAVRAESARTTGHIAWANRVVRAIQNPLLDRHRVGVIHYSRNWLESLTRNCLPLSHFCRLVVGALDRQPRFGGAGQVTGQPEKTRSLLPAPGTKPGPPECVTLADAHTLSIPWNGFAGKS